MAIRCCAQVREEGRWPRFHPCKRLACVVAPNGESYCKTHDPAAQQARDEASRKKWDDKWNAERRRHRCALALDGLTDEQVEKITELDRNKIVELL